jgi:hypothetical protein
VTDDLLSIHDDLVKYEAARAKDAEMREAAIALYEFGKWSCGKDGEAAMWELLRDAIGLQAGHATKLGVHEPSDE